MRDSSLNKADIQNKIESYKIRINSRANKYIFTVPELGIHESHTDLTEGYHFTKDKMQQFIEKMISLDAFDEIILPNNKPQGIQKMNSVFVYLRRYFILFSFIVCGSILGASVGAFIVGRSITKASIKLEKKIDRALIQDDNKRKERLTKFKSKLDYLRPYIIELKSAFRD